MYKLFCVDVSLCASTKVISVGCLGTLKQNSDDERTKVFESAPVNVRVVVFVFD